MNLIIDMGNNRQKVALFDKDLFIDKFSCTHLQPKDIAVFLASHKVSSPNVIISSVGNCSAEEVLPALPFAKVIFFSTEIPTPLNVNYQSQSTLGVDRLAAAVGAKALFPTSPVVVFDAGTCITWDVVDVDNTFMGGAILPGIDMRFKALHNYTAKLPLIEKCLHPQLLGTTTQTSILSGVMNGVLFEMEGVVERLMSHYSGLKIVVGGGDYKYLVDSVKFSTFACRNVVLNGLNIILNLNE